MSVAYYVVLDIEDPGFDTSVNGKAVARASEKLASLCHRTGLQTLDSFMGQSLDDFEDFLDEDIELPDDDGQAKWFEPAEGIALIESLISAIQQSPASVPFADAVLEEFEEYKAVLEQALKIKAKWHLALDI